MVSDLAGDNEKEVQQGLMTNQTRKKCSEVNQQQEEDQVRIEAQRIDNFISISMQLLSLNF